jgi:TctA family transporter
MIARLKGFALFWYHFFVGDDWTVAIGVVPALAVTALVAGFTPHVWWITPAAALALLTVSVYRAASRSD